MVEKILPIGKAIVEGAKAAYTFLKPGLVTGAQIAGGVVLGEGIYYGAKRVGRAIGRGVDNVRNGNSYAYKVFSAALAIPGMKKNTSANKRTASGNRKKAIAKKNTAKKTVKATVKKAVKKAGKKVNVVRHNVAKVVEPKAFIEKTS